MGCCTTNNKDKNISHSEIKENKDVKENQLNMVDGVDKTRAGIKHNKVDVKFLVNGQPISFENVQLLNTNTISDAIEILKEKTETVQTNYEYSFKDNNYKDLDISKPISSLTDKELLEVNIVYEGLDIPDEKNMLREYSKSNRIGNIKNFEDYFEFKVFGLKDIGLYSFNIKFDEYQELKKFNNTTSYCNGNDHLYISGGETVTVNDQGENNVEFNDWIFRINLQDGKVTKLNNLIHKRSLHGMIFIPSKYIFFVGGNSKRVEYLNLSTMENYDDSELNEYHYEPTLFLTNSTFLYSFLGHTKEDFSNAVERCNLRSKHRNWEIINLKNHEGVSFFVKTRFSACVNYDSSNILILGGNSTESDLSILDSSKANANTQETVENVFSGKTKKYHSYLFNFNTNTIEEYEYNNSTHIGNENAWNQINSEVFIEKKFVPLVQDNEEILYCLTPVESHLKFKVYTFNQNKELEIKEFEEESVSEILKKDF